MRLGFIGTGRMGRPMAANLLKAGYSLVVHDIQKAAADELVAAGANWADSPEEVAQASDVVLLCLPGPKEVEQVVLGGNGILAGAKHGSLLIDLTTSYPSVLQRIAGIAKGKGVGVIDAPVGPGVEAASAGTLKIMVGGETKDVHRSLKILEAMGKTIIHVGPVGMGNSAKLIHNLLLQVNLHAIAESMALGAKLGMDLRKLYDVLSTGRASSRALTDKYPAYGFKGNFEPGGIVDHVRGIIDLATDLGKEAGVPLYFGNLALQRLVELQAKGLGGNDVTAALKLFEELIDVKIRL